MYWDRVAGLYDLFESVYNGKVFHGLGRRVAEEIGEQDLVLECACGTGEITRFLAPRCRKLVASDYSSNMLEKAAEKCRQYSNTMFRRADIMQLNCRDHAFDTVVAGNVIHLLDDPYTALEELCRVCKPGGKIIIPTYINITEGKPKWMIWILEKTGINFQRQFDFDSYVRFFAEAGYTNVRFDIVDGRMPCAVAVIIKEENR